jgi:lupus La protein
MSDVQNPTTEAVNVEANMEDAPVVATEESKVEEPKTEETKPEESTAEESKTEEPNHKPRTRRNIKFDPSLLPESNDPAEIRKQVIHISSIYHIQPHVT